MKDIKFPVTEIEKDKFQITIDLKLYNKEVVIPAIYKFSHLFYIHQIIDSDNSDCVNIIFESKDGNLLTNEIPKQFCNELIDQQIRYITNKQFGHIRDMIVKEAFKPVNSTK